MENLVGNTIGLIHLISSLFALISGALVLIMKKGTRNHRQIGYAYLVSMAILLITAFLIYRLFNGWGIFHYAAIASLVTIVLGMVPIWTKKPSKTWGFRHFSFMYWSVIGLYAAFVSEVLTRIPGTPFFGMVGIATGIIMIIGSVFFGINKSKWIKILGVKKILLLTISLQLLSCQNDQEQFNLTQGLYISNITIISSEDANYNPFVGHLLIEKNKIIYIDKKKPSISGTFEKIDGTGKFLIPGLIDSHVHITEVQGMLPYHMDKHPELTEEFHTQMPRSYLYYGFTTLINLGGISEKQIENFNSQPIKPDLYHTGRSGASVANGYPMNFAPEEFRFEGSPNFIYIQSEAEHIPSKYAPENHSPKAVVERIKNAGAVAVKSYYESGFRGMPKLPFPTKSIMNDLLREAHTNGLVLTVHGNSLEAHSFLADVGVDIIAHGLWNWEKHQDVPHDSLPSEIKNVLDIQIQKQLGYTPTLTVIAGEEALADDKFLNDPELAKIVPKNLIDWYKTEEGQWFANELFKDYAAEEVHIIYGNIQAHAMLALKYLSDNGGLILFGTDTPSAPTYGNQPGHNGYWELKLMYEAGVPLNKILASATINNAKAFNLNTEIGSIQVGKKANMLLLTKNPLKEIEAYNSIVNIVLKGEILNRENLSVK